MKTISIKGCTLIGQGCFGEYVQLNSKRGVKILYSTGYLTKSALKVSNKHKEAMEEHRIIRSLRKITFIPRSYGVVAIKDKGLFYVGILMEHIDGILYGDYKTTRLNKQKIYYSLNKKLRKAGVIHNDLGGSNIIMKKIKSKYVVYAIDFTPSNIKIDKEKLKNYKR